MEEAQKWPDLLSIVEQRVKPRREELRPTPIAKRLQRYWWRFWADRPGLTAAIAELDRCLLTAQTPKHLAFSFHHTKCVFGNTLIVFPIKCASAFAVLQSRIHAFWARFLSSTLKDDGRYIPSDCFSTFPFPTKDPRAVIPDLEDLGERLHALRANVMCELQLGLTKLYDLMVDSQCKSQKINNLRELHLLVDKATLSAYGWSDIRVPSYPSPSSPEESIELEKFEDEVIDRLLLLNAQRAEEERREALSLAQREDGGPKSKRGKKKAKTQEDQMSLIGTDKKD